MHKNITELIQQWPCINCIYVAYCPEGQFLAYKILKLYIYIYKYITKRELNIEVVI